MSINEWHDLKLQFVQQMYRMRKHQYQFLVFSSESGEKEIGLSSHLQDPLSSIGLYLSVWHCDGFLDNDGVIFVSILNDKFSLGILCFGLSCGKINSI